MFPRQAGRNCVGSSSTAPTGKHFWGEGMSPRRGHAHARQVRCAVLDGETYPVQQNVSSLRSCACAERTLRQARRRNISRAGKCVPVEPACVRGTRPATDSTGKHIPRGEMFPRRARCAPRAAWPRRGNISDPGNICAVLCAWPRRGNISQALDCFPVEPVRVRGTRLATGSTGKHITDQELLAPSSPCACAGRDLRRARRGNIFRAGEMFPRRARCVPHAARPRRGKKCCSWPRRGTSR